MFNYKSRELKSINDTIIFAFDPNPSSNAQVVFGISKPKDDKGKDINIIERNIYVLRDTILQEN
jgi:hypothetical protein